MLTIELKDKFNKFLEEVDERQRFWLSGYLEGLIGKHEQTTIRNEPTESLSIAVLYASQTGNSRSIAQQLYQLLQKLSVTVVLHDCAHIQPSQLSQYFLLWFVTSTHGEGEPPESASNFFNRLEKRAQDLTGISFGVFALGDSSYEQFCATGIWLSKRIEQLGADQMHPPVLCDLDYQDDADAWLNQAMESSKRKIEEQTNNNNRVIGGINSKAILANSQLLNDHRSDKKTWHFEIETQLDFQPGDALAIHPKNPDDLIQAVKSLIEPALKKGELIDEKTIQRLDKKLLNCDLSKVTKKLLASYMDCLGNQALKKHYAQLDEKALSAWLRKINLLTLISEYPPQASAEQLLDWLQTTLTLKPRLYSIASSPLAFAGEIHIAVRVIDREKGSPFGIASNMLCQLENDSELDIKIEKQEHFQLPEDKDTDIIMIGAGTGIAPYRAFLQHRQQQQSKARHWLFYGDRTMRYDFLYQKEILDWKQQGLITNLDTAFSRQGKEKKYVQHAIEQKATELFQWLQQGAVVYVCGDASAMAPSVHAALTNAVAQEKKCDAQEAEYYIEELRSKKRYQRDVY